MLNLAAAAVVIFYANSPMMQALVMLVFTKYYISSQHNQ